jgi:histidinol phosphatase-like enzyme
VPVVLTNNPGVARKMFTRADVDAVHGRMNALLGDAAI